ncbi:MAG: UDP-N-acetylmuramoyl-L-alanine--D-glutamate ligase [bacterium]|nr:UDP-N-acetylmuramoyl-L-alanine--D-glutamate ligase [bacterium]MDZ4285857.1 UDP-N-acetylmuramoyl-L-alanine--D-glutamate ligase [Candidatus Sungbacteria bacterium]
MNTDFTGKKILIMGLGLHGGGVGTARFFAKRGASLVITDLRTKAQLESSIAKLKEFSHITYVLGEHRKSDFLQADLIVKNPGVPPTSPYIKLARDKGIPITTDIGIFLRQCPAQIIGVTGTRGKSTTCFLISRFLEVYFKKNKKDSRKRVFLGGNIRKSVLEFMDDVRSHDVVILELSSFQMDDMLRDSWKDNAHVRKSPHIAVITNILRDHLNWHGSMQSYVSAKSVIFKYQDKEDILFANGSDPVVRGIAIRAPGRVEFPKLPAHLKATVDKNLGSHYETSVALAVGVAKHFGVSPDVIRSTLTRFYGLPGRQELVGRIRGISLINDTTATIPDASIAAIKRFRKEAKKSRLILIAGGSDKKLKFSDMAGAIAKHIDLLVLLPGTATDVLLRIIKKKKAKKHFAIQMAASMDEAVNTAVYGAKKGDFILLSPGAASFGLFANEFDRGDKFVAALSAVKSR